MIQPSDFVVTNTNDSGSGSLRQAITYANLYGQPENITFDIPTTDPNYSSGVFTIKPATALPTITDPGLGIDGRTETENNSSISNPAGGPVVYLNGNNQTFAGLTVAASGDIIANLGVDDFAGTAAADGGILLTGNATQSVIKGCYLGIASNGSSAAANGIGISTVGELIGGNTINAGSGQTDPDVIGFNTDGILLGGPGDTVDLADVGVTPAGVAVANSDGIVISGNGNTVESSTLSDNTIGLSISGNSNQILSNEIGTNAAGTAAAPNALTGVSISGSADTLSGDVISGNGLYGVYITGSGNTVTLCTVGLNAAGTAAVPNSAGGIYISGANNTIGGSSFASAGNVISGNTALSGFFSGPGAGVELDTSGAVTKTRPCAKRSKPAAAACGFCPPTAPTSTPSNTPSPSSSKVCARPRRAPRKRSKPRLPPRWRPSPATTRAACSSTANFHCLLNHSENCCNRRRHRQTGPLAGFQADRDPRARNGGDRQRENHCQAGAGRRSPRGRSCGCVRCRSTGKRGRWSSKASPTIGLDLPASNGQLVTTRARSFQPPRSGPAPADCSCRPSPWKTCVLWSNLCIGAEIGGVSVDLPRWRDWQWMHRAVFPAQA